MLTVIASYIWRLIRSFVKQIAQSARLAIRWRIPIALSVTLSIIASSVTVKCTVQLPLASFVRLSIASSDRLSIAVSVHFSIASSVSMSIVRFSNVNHLLTDNCIIC